jgi:hypothetical protein
MSRPIAYNASGPLSGSIRGGSVNYTVDSGNRDYTTFASKKWVPSADGVAPIVFVTDTYTQGIELNPSLAVPLFFSCNGTGSAAIIYTANRVPGSPGNYSDANVALNDLITARGYFILESNDPFEGVDADSLVFDVDASKMSSYPQVGTNWRDLSGQGNTAALTNGPVWNSSGWFNFDGTDDYGYNGSTSLNITGNVTLNAWVRNNGTGTNVGNYMSKAQNNGYRMRRNGTSGSPLWLYSFGNTINGGAIYDNIWYMVTGVFSDTGLRAYINGTLVASNSTPYSPSSLTLDGLYIGAYTNGAEYFGGDIVNAQVYASALTEAQVKQNYFSSPIVTDGLVFAVDANNIVSYPKSGTTAYSLTGSNTATLVNGVAYGLQNGGSFIFDGTDDYIQTNLSQNTDNALITWECWYFDDSPGGYVSNTALISNYGPSGTTPFTSLHVTTAGTVFFGQRNSGGSEAQAVYSGNICDGRWHHVVGTVDSSNISIYIDGALQASNTKVTGVTTSGQNIVIGSNHLDRYQSCRMANTRLYNVALTPSQILQNYQAEQYRFKQSPGYPINGLLLYLDAGNANSYPGTGTTWYDLSGNGANATMFNGMETGWNPTGYFQLDGTDDYADSIAIDQEYRDLIIGLWSENSSGNLEMVFAKQGGADKSLRLNVNQFRTSVQGTDGNDWNYLEDASTFGDGVFGQAVNCSGGWHIIRGYRSNDSFGTAFRYSISSTFLSSARMYHGKLAFILAYNRKLDQQEVLQLYWYFQENKLPT